MDESKNKMISDVLKNKKDNQVKQEHTVDCCVKNKTDLLIYNSESVMEHSSWIHHGEYNCYLMQSSFCH